MTLRASWQGSKSDWPIAHALEAAAPMMMAPDEALAVADLPTAHPPIARPSGRAPYGGELAMVASAQPNLVMATTSTTISTTTTGSGTRRIRPFPW